MTAAKTSKFLNYLDFTPPDIFMFAFYLLVFCTYIHILHCLFPFNIDHEHVAYFPVVFIILMVAFYSSL